MADNLEPVHEACDDASDDEDETIKPKSDGQGVSPAMDVNDVDHVELEVANEANAEIYMGMVNLTMNLVHMVMARVMATITAGNEEIAKEELDVDPVGLERKEFPPAKGEDGGGTADRF